MKTYKNYALALCICMLAISNFHASAQGYLRREGQHVVNDNGTFKMRGTSIGSWMVLEGYILGIKANQVSAPRQVHTNIADLVGGDAMARTILEEFRDNFVREPDIRALKSIGYNHIRLPFHYADFYDTARGVNSDAGFRRIDTLLSWCRQNQMYLIPDLHCAPGSQNPGWHSDHVTGQPVTFFNNLEYMKLAAGIWKRIAIHYRDEPWIGAYDLLNEPAVYGADTAKVLPFYLMARDSIRLVDTRHMLIAEGNNYGFDLNDIFDKTVPNGRWDDNLCLSTHSYYTTVPSPNVPEVIRVSTLMDVPVWLGEFGNNSNTWMGNLAKYYESKGWGWANWTFKKVQSINPVFNIPVRPKYKKVLDYWDNPATAPRPSIDTAIAAFREMNADYIWRPDMRWSKDLMDALFREDFQTRAIPYKDHHVPGTIMLADYNMGADGLGCHIDNDIQTLSNNPFVIWNTGWNYRNDAIDIQETVYGTPTIGWTKANEWMEYTFTADNADPNYKVSISTASAQTGGRIHVDIDGVRAIASTNTPGTGGWATWHDTDLGTVNIPAGSHLMRFTLEGANLNVKSLTFTSLNGVSKTHYAAGLKIYPNPAENVIRIEAKGEVSIFDIQGRQVYAASDETTGLMKDLDVSNLPAGIYAVRCGGFTGRFVKE
ncbi:MAG: carbohydrate-binding protein [Bacteroidota bacterium]